jgi:DNA-binding MarR family transcriptional regulator
MIGRTMSAFDRRSREVSISDKGSELLDLIASEVLELQNDILCGLSDEEKSQLLVLMTKTTDAGNTKSRAPFKKAHR